MYETSRQTLAEVELDLCAGPSKNYDLTARCLEDGVVATHVADCDMMLGCHFSPQKDELSLVEFYSNDESFGCNINISKRLVLSTLANFLKLTSYANPVLTKSKIFLQKL